MVTPSIHFEKKNWSYLLPGVGLATSKSLSKGGGNHPPIENVCKHDKCIHQVFWLIKGGNNILHSKFQGQTHKSKDYFKKYKGSLTKASLFSLFLFVHS